jgi:hypothetical protein
MKKTELHLRLALKRVEGLPMLIVESRDTECPLPDTTHLLDGDPSIKEVEKAAQALSDQWRAWADTHGIALRFTPGIVLEKERT